MTSLMASALVALLSLHVWTSAEQPPCQASPRQTFTVVASQEPVDMTVIRGGKLFSPTNKDVNVPVINLEEEPRAVLTTPSTQTIATEPQTIAEQVNLHAEPVAEDTAGEFNCVDEGSFGIPGNCTHQHQCVYDGDGGYTKHLFKCGTGFVWDAKIRGCNFMSSVDPPCGTRQAIDQEANLGTT